MNEAQGIIGGLDFTVATAHIVLSAVAVKLSRGWRKSIGKSIELNVKPTAEEIELICDLVDCLHDNGQHEEGHLLDGAMCDWAALLIDA